MNIKQIDLKYRTFLQGKHNKTISICPECNINLTSKRNKNGTLADNVIGYSDSNLGVVEMIECPKCFFRWKYHANQQTYNNFLISIANGKQKHYKGVKNENK